MEAAWARSPLHAEAQGRQRVARHAADAPIGHDRGPHLLVEADRVLVPVEHAPFEAAVVALHRQPGEPRQQGLADALAAAEARLARAAAATGTTTKQAVMAFQKYMGLEATAKVDQATADALTLSTTRAVGQSNEPGTLVEIDKDKQVLFIMNAGKLLWALNISTGSGQYFLEINQKDLVTWETGRSLTPSGRYKINREKSEGWWDGDLGQIYRPKYFNGGIAIHGSKKIPNYPASHGCVRVSTAAMDMIWASGLIPKKTSVWVYGNDIEAEGEPPVIPTTTTTTTTTLPVDPNLTTTIAPV